jgi:hypothetical protein
MQRGSQLSRDEGQGCADHSAFALQSLAPRLKQCFGTIAKGQLQICLLALFATSPPTTLQ